MNSFTLPCGCVILYDLDNIGDYGYGGEIVDRYEISEAKFESNCRAHTRQPADDISFGLAF